MRLTLRGDTLIEVMLSISIFAVVAMLSINLMNDGINTAQRTLEVEMARNEMDAQVEALRFIHTSYVAERQMTTDESGYKTLWNKITSFANGPAALENDDFDINNFDSCSDIYSGGTNSRLAKYKSFALNTRLVLPDAGRSQRKKYLGVSYTDLLNNEIIISYQNSASKFAEPALHPRIIYREFGASETTNTANANMSEGEKLNHLYNLVSSAEGIWIDVAGNNTTNLKRSDYFDFYVRTCWQSAGTRVPSTLTTVVRLYNPEVLQ